MAGKPDYAELVAQAEKAVGGVNDPELKRIAFQKVLDDLLAIGGGQPAEAPAGTKKKKKGGKIVRGRGGKILRGRGVAKGGTQTYLRELVDDGFFKKPKTITNVKAELENRGHHIPMTSLSGPLQRFVQQRVLRRERLKVGNKQTFAYSNW
jgi:hypothetical protein